MAKELLKLSVDAAEFAAFTGKTSQLPKNVKKELRTAVKKVGDETLAEVQKEVQKPPLVRGSRRLRSNVQKGRGLRAGILQGLKVRMATTDPGKAGVMITAGTSGLGPTQKKLLRKYNSENGWRHPSLGTAKAMNRLRRGLPKGVGGDAVSVARNVGKWYPQKGRPYFGKVIAARQEKDMAEIIEAMSKARRSSGLG